MTDVPFRPLGKAMSMLAATGLDSTYAYDDLVFSEHSVIIIQFDKHNADGVSIFFNQDCEINTAAELKKILIETAPVQNLQISRFGKFKMDENLVSEEIKIEFLD